MARPEIGDSADVDSLSDSDSDDADGIAELDTESESVGDVENPDVEEDAPDLEEPNSEEDEGPEEDSDFDPESTSDSDPESTSDSDPESTSDSDPESTTDLDRNEPDAESEDAEACACSTNDECCDGCQARPMDSACDDGNPCTDNDRCRAGRCVGIPTPESRACDDDDPISRDDRCAAGRCTGSPKVEWVVRSSGDAKSWIRAVAVDARSNTYLLGSVSVGGHFGFGALSISATATSWSNESEFLAKLGPDGQPLWIRTEQPTGSGTPILVDPAWLRGANTICADAVGRVYVGVQGAPSIIQSFDPDGGLGWRKVFPYSGDTATSFVCDFADGIVVSGTYSTNGDTTFDPGHGPLPTSHAPGCNRSDEQAFVAKYHGDGRLAWARGFVVARPVADDDESERYESADRCDYMLGCGIAPPVVETNGAVLVMVGCAECVDLGDRQFCNTDAGTPGAGTGIHARIGPDGEIEAVGLANFDGAPVRLLDDGGFIAARTRPLPYVDPTDRPKTLTLTRIGSGGVVEAQHDAAVVYGDCGMSGFVPSLDVNATGPMSFAAFCNGPFVGDGATLPAVGLWTTFLGTFGSDLRLSSLTQVSVLDPSYAVPARVAAAPGYCWHVAVSPAASQKVVLDREGTPALALGDVPYVQYVARVCLLP